jgi:hypothetical protein
MARITHIQTGAERAAGRPAQAHDEDMHARMQAAQAESARRIADTRARIEQIRADNARTFPRP